MKSGKILIFMLFIVFCSEVLQAAGKYPVQYSQYMNCNSLINPAYIIIDELTEINFGSHRIAQQQSNFTAQFAQLSLCFKSIESSGLGFRFSNEKEGLNISSNEMFLTYVWRGKLPNDYFIAGGIDIGFVNMIIDGTASTGNGADTKISSNVGILIYNNDFNVGFSCNQIRKAELQPLKGKLALQRYYTFTSSYNFKVTDYYTVKTFLLGKHFEGEHNEIDVSIKNSIGNTLSILGGYRSMYGLLLMVGIENIDILNGALDFFVSYNTPTSFNAVNINTYELMLKYKLKK